MPTLLGAARRKVNTLLAATGFVIVPADQAYNRDDEKTFIPFHATLAGARAAGLSVADYLDVRYNQPGATQFTIDQMASLGVFDGPLERVCEIGPGSGRYLEKVIRGWHPSYYEIYETAPDWADWLVRTYGVTLRPTNGSTLVPTPSRSIDLVHAHKVFSTVASMTTFGYLSEMARVVADDGRVVFDVMTEECVDEETLQRWFTLPVRSAAYPSLLPKRVVVEYLARRHLALVGSFVVPMVPGRTECLVFRRTRE